MEKNQENTKNPNQENIRNLNEENIRNIFNLLHICICKTSIIDIFSLGAYEFYFLEHIFYFYYKNIPKCSYNILLD